MAPNILCSNSPQIHLNNHPMCRFQFLPYGMHRFQQTISRKLIKHSICSLQLIPCHCIIFYSQLRPQDISMLASLRGYFGRNLSPRKIVPNVEVETTNMSSSPVHTKSYVYRPRQIRLDDIFVVACIHKTLYYRAGGHMVHRSTCVHMLTCTRYLKGLRPQLKVIKRALQKYQATEIPLPQIRI